MKAEMKKGMCRLHLPGEVTIYTALALKDEMLSHLKQVWQLELDCSHVTEIDTAGIQLLIMLKNEAAQCESKLALVGHSQAVTDLIDAYNLAGFFGDPIVLHEQQ